MRRILFGLLLVLLLAACGSTQIPTPAPMIPVQPLSSVTVAAPPLPTPTPTPVPAPQLQVVGVDMTVAPAILSEYQCGSHVVIDYTATFHFNDGNAGGTVTFAYTTDNGRGTQQARLTVGPGQTEAVYTFYWSGFLPADHTEPGLGGVLVMAPNALQSGTVEPAGECWQ